jgi:hypothetical protein
VVLKYGPEAVWVGHVGSAPGYSQHGVVEQSDKLGDSVLKFALGSVSVVFGSIEVVDSFGAHSCEEFHCPVVPDGVAGEFLDVVL